MTQRDFGNFNSAINPGADLVTTQDGSVRIGGIDLAAFAKDASGNVTGLVGPGGEVINLKAGYRAVLYGDSMTANANEALTSSTCTYNSSSGVLVYPHPSTPLLTGMVVKVYSLGEPGLAGGITGAVTKIDANTVSMLIGANLNISATISGIVFMMMPAWLSSKGWFTWVNILSGNRFNVVSNSAQNGDVTSNMLARIKPNLTYLHPQVVFMQLGGINDLGAGVGEETIWQNQQALMAEIASQAVLVLLTTTPVGASHALATQQHMARVARMRTRVLEYVKNKTNIILVDAYSRIVDPTNSIGLANSSFLLSDGIHYSPAGAYQIGKLVWDTIAYQFPGLPSMAPVSAADNYSSSAVTLTSSTRSNGVVTGTLTNHGILLGEKIKIIGGAEAWNVIAHVTAATTNTLSWLSDGADGAITGTVTVGRNPNMLQTPLLLVATGGIVSGANASGVAAANVRVTQSGTWGTGGSIVASVVSNPSGFGNNQQIVATPGTGSVANPTAVIQVAASNTLLPLMKSGRHYKFGCELTVGNVAGSTATEIKARLITTIDSAYPEITVLKAVDGAVCVMPDGAYNLETPYYAIAAGSLTAVQWEIDLKFNAVSSQPVTLSVGRLYVIEQEML